jgi:hypothetical protein
MIKRMGSMFSVVQVGSGVRPGMITDDSETHQLDILESELVGEVCGAPDSARHYSIYLFRRIL